MKAGRILFTAMLIFALVTLPSALYVVGYFWLGKPLYWTATSPVCFFELPTDCVAIERLYLQRWQMTIYQPAARLETWVRGVDVQATSSESPGPAIEHTGDFAESYSP